MSNCRRINALHKLSLDKYLDTRSPVYLNSAMSSLSTVSPSHLGTESEENDALYHIHGTILPPTRYGVDPVIDDVEWWTSKARVCQHSRLKCSAYSNNSKASKSNRLSEWHSVTDNRDVIGEPCRNRRHVKQCHVATRGLTCGHECVPIKYWDISVSWKSTRLRD
jgi:hypothetical protein